MSPTTLNLVSSQFWTLAAPILIKASLLLLASLITVLAFRRSAASSRHLVWTLGIAGVLAMPALSSLLPALEIELPKWQNEQSATAALTVDPLPATTQPAFERSALETAEPRPESISVNATVDLPQQSQLPVPTRNFVASLRELSPPSLALLAWEFGLLCILIYFGLGRLRLRSLERASSKCQDAMILAEIDEIAAEIGLRQRPQVLCSRESVTPMTWGFLRPQLLLPADCVQWDREQRRNVLLHELHHIKRRDAWSQSLAQLACALFWFHPLVWIAERSMRRERERACDDQVLMAGSKASSYADHLLTMARSLRCEERTAFASVAMARRSELSSRLLAVLDPKLDRNGPGRSGSIAIALFCISILLPLAALRPAADAAPPDRKSQRQVVTAPWIAPVPKVGVTTPVAPLAHVGLSPRLDGNPVLAVAPRLDVRTPVALAMGDGSWHLSGDDGRVSWQYSHNGEKLWVEMEGKVEFNDAETDIVDMEPNSYFEIGEGRGRDARRVEFEADRDGNITKAFFEGRREQDFDAEAEEWLAEVLPKAARNLGINIGPRTARIYERDGVEGFLRELDDIDSDYMAKQYANAFLDLDQPSKQERAEVLREMAKRIESDYERAELLIAQMPTFLEDDELRETLIEVVPELDSDYERSRVIQSALNGRTLSTEQASALLRATRGMSSDYELGQVLARVRPTYLEDPEVSDSYFGVVQGLDSDYERSQLLQTLLRDASSDPALANKILDAAAEIDSDYERGQVLGSFLSKTDLGRDQMLKVIEIVDGIDSDYERTNLIIEIAQQDIEDDEVREALMQAIDRIDGEYEYGRAMRAVRRHMR